MPRVVDAARSDAGLLRHPHHSRSGLGGGRPWRKQPLGGVGPSDHDEDQITAWRRKWPDARPGVPLAAVGWCVVDVDDPERAAFWEVWDALGRVGRIQSADHRAVAGTSSSRSRRNRSRRCSGARVSRSLARVVCSPSTTSEAILFPRVARGRCCRRFSGSRMVRLEVYPIKKRARLQPHVRAWG